MKFMIDFMADETDKVKELERERVFQTCQRRRRTQREDLGGLKLADNSPPYPRHQYVPVNPRPKVLNLKISLNSTPKKRKLDSDSPDEERKLMRSKAIVIRDRDQEKNPGAGVNCERVTEKKEKRMSEFDLSGEELERRRSKANGIVIGDRDQEKRPSPNAVRGRETEKKEKRMSEFDLSDEELERRRSKGRGIVIWDADQEKKPFATADREKETEKNEKKNKNKNKGKKKCTDDDEFKPEKKLKNKKSQVVVNLPTPELPSGLRARMAEKAREFGQTDIGPVVLVIHKEISMSDIARQQNRLTIPVKQVRGGFLKPEEEDYLSERVGINTAYISVPIIEPTGGVSQVNLRKWDIGKNSVSYILNGDWKHVVSLNRLREGQIVAVWAFWIMGRLNLAFVFSENRQREDGASTSQALAVVETADTPTTAAVTETETGAGTRALGSEEDSNRRGGGLDFDLNMEPDEF